jgi:Transglutaminase-like superfamily
VRFRPRLAPTPTQARHVARVTLWVFVTVLVTIPLDGARSAASAPAISALRWTDTTPDTMLDNALARALAPESPERARAAAVAMAVALADRAGAGRARDALERIAAAGTVPPELRAETALLARTLGADEGTGAGLRRDRGLGVVQDLSVLGPFRDNGGGLVVHDGPEDARAAEGGSGDHSWGSYEVRWRPVPPAFAGARGVPLELFVFPRKESCTWVATRLAVGRAQRLTLRVAAAGQVRLAFDGHDAGRDDDVHRSMGFDRVAARVDATAGAHLVAAKVCSGALDDDGRVRLRVTDDEGRWPDGVTAAALAKDAAATAAGPAALHPMTTPLGRALDVPSDADPDARIDGAVLRTLGGADDLRSPRAPGILSALADGPLSPDRLAMVAWLAPSGANRGAWLNRARGQADGATRAFVDRRLVERHIEAQLPDWAMASLRGAEIDHALDPEATMLSAQVELALGTEALRIRALRRLEVAARASPQTAPDALLELVARSAEGLRPDLELWAREELATRGEIGADRVRTLASTRGRVETVRAAARAFAEGALDDADDAVAITDAVATTGADAEALALLRQAATWAPNRAAVWSAIAREAAAGQSPVSGSADAADARDADRAKAVAVALRRARELDPGEARYRAELALRARTPTGDADTRDDEKYIVAAPVILARRTNPGPAGTGAATASTAVDDGPKGAPTAKSSGPAPKPVPFATDVADRELHWLRAVVMHADRRVSEMVHYAREIVIAPRTEDELYEDIPAEGDSTEILRARVHRKDGGIAFPVEEANENAHPRIRWPELSSGDVVEVAFRSWTAGPVGGRGDPPFYRLDYAGALSTHPVLYNEVIVEAPSDRPIFVDVVNGKPDRREERDEGGRRVVRLVWPKPATVPDEPLAPPLSEVIPTVVLSTFKDWDAFRAWYGEAVLGFTEPDAQVRELAAKLTKGRATRDDRVRAIFDFVADDIRYVNYVSGEWWLPNRPQQLLARREGDCDDKALLLITLLKAVGIDAQEVMVQTRLTGQPSILRARGAAIPLFDHGIAFLPGPHGGRYLDATSPQSRLGPLPSMDARGVALRLDGPAQVVDLPASSPDDHGVDATWTVKLDEDGRAQLDGQERASGDDAFWMRTNLTEPGARAQWVEDRLVSWFSSVEVDQKVDFRGDLPQGAASLAWHARSGGLARHEGPELVVSLAPAQTLAAQLAPLVRRTLPVWLPPHVAPRRESGTIRVVAPEGWRFEELPPGGDENGGPFGRAHLDVARDPADPRAVVARRTLVFDQSTVPVDQYPAWRAWVQRVDALMHKTLRVTRTGATP